MNLELSDSSYSLLIYIALFNGNDWDYPKRSLVCSLALIPIIMHLHCSLSEVAFRPRQLAHVLQYMDFFTYNCWRAILTDGKQLHYRLTDAFFFPNGSEMLGFPFKRYDANG